MLDYARVDHLLHEVRRRFARLHVLLKLQDLLLELMDLLHPCLVLGLLLCSSFLIRLDLLEGSSSLACDLHHVR